MRGEVYTWVWSGVVWVWAGVVRVWAGVGAYMYVGLYGLRSMAVWTKAYGCMD